MKLFSSFFHGVADSAPIAIDLSVDSWCHQLHAEPARLVSKIEMCTAIAAGEDVWGMTVDKTHLHTLLRVSLVPTTSASEEVLLIERVLSTGGAYHSVTPIKDVVSQGGTMFHPKVHDRICVIKGDRSTELAHHLEVERTLIFGSSSSTPHLTLAEFGQILEFVSRSSKLICAGGDCKYESRSFAFTCLTALTPSLPPCMLVRKEGERVDMNAKHGPQIDDFVFEQAASTFLAKSPWLFTDPVSTQALALMVFVKGQSRVATTARV